LEKKPSSISPQREKMLENASTLFWKKGYSGTSMRDIAKVCKCKPANIYNFFRNKEEILFECLYTQNTRLLGMIKHFESDRITKPSEQLREFIIIHLNHVLRYIKTSRLLFDTGLERLSRNNRRKVVSDRDTYDRILTGIIQRGIETKEFSEIDAKLVTRNVASMIVRTIIWYSPEGPLSINDIAEFIFNLTTNGLKGRKNLK
jgi:TetR/AcrR family transcriptional regulator, cholesterol catabolism regulator